MMNHKTTITKASEIKRAWHIVDLENQTLGRVSTTIATKLIGKHKPTYVPNLDCGDYVVVINASKVKVTGKKPTDKLYQWHSGHPGGFKQFSFKEMMDKDPAKVLQHAIKGMLPKNKLRSPRLKRLKIFSGSDHPYARQIESTK